MAISLAHKSITIDVNDRNAPNVVAIANVNDKAVRYLDVTLTASGNKLTFTGCTATATFATDGYLISDSVACTINSAADVITVPLENFNSMSGFLAIEIKIANGETQVLNTPLALKVKVTPSLLDKSMISKDSVGTAAEICREVATARGGSNSLGARLNEIDSSVSDKADKSTVSQLSARMQTAEKALAGKANATDIANALKSKEDNSNKVSSKTDVTDSSTNYPSVKYLNDFYYDANETYSSAETDELLKNKADSNSVYSKVEADDLLGEKADKVDVTNHLSKLKVYIDDLSIGDYIIKPAYHSGKIDPATGEEVTPYDTARISEKLNFDNYERVNVDSGKKLYISVFEFDSSGKYIKQIANTLHNYTIIPTNGHLYVLQWWYGDSDDFENRLSYTKVLAKSLLNKKDKEQIYTDLSPKTEVKLDLPDKLFIVKGETLELFKYGMYCTDTEFINNQYNVRVVNINKYTAQYDDKIVISCPKDYSKPILQGDNDLALFQLIDTYGKVIEQKRVKIFVADKATISDIDRNIMYLGDSFTGMGFRTQEIANLIAKETNLTKTKLIGRSIGQGSGNRFTGTGGYSWANYTENPNTLPSAYPNNYLWVDNYNNISMSHFVKNVLNEIQLDYLVILLGWNDYENGAFASKFNWSDLKMRAKKLIENTHAGFPNCKIILESYHYMYPLHRKSYGGALPQVRQNKYIYDLNRFYQEIANEYEYVEFVQMSIQIDVLHNMGFEKEKVNKRSEEIVKYCKDVVHPADIGFYQYSDAEFAALLYLMQ